MADAHYLVCLSECLTNSRARGMRKELRERVGHAIRVSPRRRDQLDCLESEDVFLVFKPGSRLGRTNFMDHRPLLRQALVAACAATETYLADKVMTRVRDLTASHDSATPKLRNLGLTVGDWLYIEQHHTYRRRALHNRVIENHVREAASTSPNQVGALLSLIGVASPLRQLDHHRTGAKRGDTEDFLQRITERRNQIVHSGDRQGRGRASLTVLKTKGDLDGLESVVDAIEKLLA